MRPPAPPLPPRPTFLNDAAMVFLRTAGLVAFLCLLLLVFGNERTGFILLGGLSIASIAAGVTVVLAYSDQMAEELVTTYDEAPAVRPVRFGPLPAESGTPVAGVAAIVLIAGGLLYGVSPANVRVGGRLLPVGGAPPGAGRGHRGRAPDLLPPNLSPLALARIG